MAFSKRYNNNERQSFDLPQKTRIRFFISERSFKIGSVASSLSFTMLFIILYVLKSIFLISETDIQCICQITAGLSGLTLAIPLFLKDFEITSNFWRQFYLIAITFLIATLVGVLSFLQTNATDIERITFYFYFFLSITLSVDLFKIFSLNRFIKIRWKSKFSLNPLINFGISYLILISSLFFYSGNFLMYSAILFTIYGFYLTFSLVLAILIELFITNKETNTDNNKRIKEAIQSLAYKNKYTCLSEQDIIDKLRKEIFVNEQEIISRTIIQEFVTEMDLESDSQRPKITIDSGSIIPRWISEFDTILLNSEPKYVIIKYDKEIRKADELDYLIRNQKFENDYLKELYKLTSERTGLSIELLKDNDSLEKKYKIIRHFTLTRSSWGGITNYLLLIDKSILLEYPLPNVNIDDKYSSILSISETNFLISGLSNKKIYYNENYGFENIIENLKENKKE